MSKKYRLEIPEKMLRWVREELKERQGKICDMWDEELFSLGWLTQIKEPLSFEEWMGGNFPGLVVGDFEYDSRYEVWNSALKNQKLGQNNKSCPLYVDYEKSRSAFKERIKELER